MAMWCAQLVAMFTCNRSVNVPGLITDQKLLKVRMEVVSLRCHLVSSRTPVSWNALNA